MGTYEVSSNIDELKITYLDRLSKGSSMIKLLLDYILPNKKFTSKSYDAYLCCLSGLAHAHMQGNIGCIISLNKNFYLKKNNYVVIDGRKIQSKLTYTAVVDLIDEMIKQDYIIHCKGYLLRKSGKSVPGYVVFTDKFKRLIEERGVKMNKKLPLRSYVILRDQDGNDMTFTCNGEIKKTIDLLKEYEQMMEGYDIEVRGGMITPYLCRIFKETFEQQGRLYARGQSETFQMLSQAVRRQISIDDEETVELDFSAMHLNILYDLEDVPLYGQDVYSLLDFDFNKIVDNACFSIFEQGQDYAQRVIRRFLKLMFLVMLNCKSRSSGIKALLAELHKDSQNLDFDKKSYWGIRVKQETLEELIDAIYAANEPVNKYFFTAPCDRLTYIDSEIMLNIVGNCIRRFIPVLPIHDSVIVQKSQFLEVQEIMEKAYENVVGSKFNCKVEVK